MSATPVRRSIYLVGFMGSGKTTLGRLLAAELSRPFLDLDAEVERRAGTTIAALWERRGEEAFREEESAALRAVAGRDSVIATGGGTPVRADNRAVMASTGIVLWLKLPLELILRRVDGASARARPLWRDERQDERQDEPAFRSLGQLGQLYRARQSAYAFADKMIELGEESPEQALRLLALALAPLVEPA